MRVMVIVKADTDSEAGVPPSEGLLREMARFNEELATAGVLLGGEGLHPSSKGKRVRLSARGTSVTDGPFAATRELVAGFWILQVESMEEALAWVRRIPDPAGETGQETEIEIRPIYEPSDFAEVMGSAPGGARA